MKKSLIALAILVMTGSVFAVNVTANVQGGINNSINASSMVFGTGTSVSGAGSTASSAGTATTNTSTGAIAGATDTTITGFAYNMSTGTGTGAAHARGWSDAGSTATLVYGSESNTVTITGGVDTGRPTNVNFGPDLSLTVSTNQGAVAVGQAGGTFAGTVNLQTGLVADTQSVTTYAQAGQSNIPGSYVTKDGTNQLLIGGFTNGSYVNATVLNAGSQASVTATGNFTQ